MENEEKLLSWKTVIKIIAGIGVGKVVDDILTAVLPKEVGIPVKILYKIGAYSLSWVIGDWAADKIGNKIEVTKMQIKMITDRVAEAQKEMKDIFLTIADIDNLNIK